MNVIEFSFYHFLGKATLRLYKFGYKYYFMQKKVSEKRLLFAVVCFVVSLILLCNATLVTSPIQISEGGLLITVASTGLFF